MFKSKILVGCVLQLYILFVFFEVIGEYTIAFHLDGLIIPLITFIYLIFIKRKSKLFLLFLIFYSVSDLMGIATSNLLYYNLPYSNKENLIYYAYDYYIDTALYILAYFFLFVKIAQTLPIGYIFKHFKIHLLVLITLNIYLVYVLQIIVEPYVEFQYEYVFEFTYNVITLMVLMVALLNFIYKDNKKALYLFIGSLCLVFSEFMDIAYIYIVQKSLLNILGTTFGVVAFYFFYQQSKILNEKNYLEVSS